MSDDTQTKTPPRHGRAWWVGWGAFILFVYALSIGPVARLTFYSDRMASPKVLEAVRAVYVPVNVVADYCPPAEVALEWYLGLWGRPSTMPDGTPSDSAWGWFIWPLVILAVYALSPAPVCFVMSKRGKDPQPVRNTVYAPLAALYDDFPAVRAFYDWYFRAWGLE